MSRSEPNGSKNQNKALMKWVVSVFLVTILVSGLISLISDELMTRSGIVVAFVILLAIVLIGIVFDVIGMAVASAQEAPFHAMAARRVPGAREAIKLLRNAERVSSICNDVVGDICGVISGSAAASIAAQIVNMKDFSWPRVVSLLMSALVAGLTVGGKAIGKTFAVNSSIVIVSGVGKFIYTLKRIPALFRKKNNKR